MIRIPVKQRINTMERVPAVFFFVSHFEVLGASNRHIVGKTASGGAFSEVGGFFIGFLSFCLLLVEAPLPTRLVKLPERCWFWRRSC